MMTPARWLAGVDGCRAGWLVVLRDLTGREASRVRIVPDFAHVLALPEQPEIIAVDIPIGLPDRSGPGGRRADAEARAQLGLRQSSVFPVPARAAVWANDYRAASALALAHSDPPRKVSKQIYNLFPKIREVDALMSAQMQRRVFEAHPEVAFWAMNGETPLGEPKKVKSAPHGPGLALRRTLLLAQGFEADLVARSQTTRSGAGDDDLLDACACAWTAARIAAGVARSFPAAPPLDRRGLRQAIWV